MMLYNLTFDKFIMFRGDSNDNIIVLVVCTRPHIFTLHISTLYTTQPGKDSPLDWILSSGLKTTSGWPHVIATVGGLHATGFLFC